VNCCVASALFAAAAAFAFAAADGHHSLHVDFLESHRHCRGINRAELIQQRYYDAALLLR
jgi:hypothetical protein